MIYDKRILCLLPSVLLSQKRINNSAWASLPCCASKMNDWYGLKETIREVNRGKRKALKILKTNFFS